MSKLGDCSDKPNELCPNVLQDFSRSERARLCETCEGLGHSCLGLNHPRLEGNYIEDTMIDYIK